MLEHPFLVRPILRLKCSMPLGISKTTTAGMEIQFFLLPPFPCGGHHCPFLREKGYFSWPLHGFSIFFKITYNLPHTENGRCIRAVASDSLAKTISYSPHYA